MPENNIKRINIRMGQELHDWFEMKGDQLGVPTSALMIIALNEYRKQQTASENLPALSAMAQLIQNGELEEIAQRVRNSASEAVLDVEKPSVIA